MNNKFTYLVNMLNNTAYYNKIAFVDNYIPSVMIRKGFDYVDSYKTSLTTTNYFLFEEKAIERYQETAMPNDTIFFRCLHINNKGQIQYLLKKKIYAQIVNMNSLNIDLSNYSDRQCRFYNEKIITDEQIIANIINLETVPDAEFIYLFYSNNILYKISISNNISADIIYNASGKKIKTDIPFYRAEFIYNEMGEFTDLNIIQ